MDITKMCCISHRTLCSHLEVRPRCRLRGPHPVADGTADRLHRLDRRRLGLAGSCSRLLLSRLPGRWQAAGRCSLALGCRANARRITGSCLNLNLSADEQKIVDILKVKGSLAYDALSLQAGMPQSKLAITVLALEMQGILVALPGKIYRLM